MKTMIRTVWAFFLVMALPTLTWAKGKEHPVEESDHRADARCQHPPGFPGNTAYTVYSTEIPVVIFDDHTGQPIAWGYGDSCIQPRPSSGSPGGFARQGPALTSLVLDLHQNAQPLPDCPGPPPTAVWAAGQDPQVRRCFLTDQFTPAYPDPRRLIRVPNANEDPNQPLGPYLVPAQVPVGIASQHRPLLEAAGVLVAPGWDDRACPSGEPCPPLPESNCHDDVTRCPPNVMRAWLEHLPAGAPRRYAKAYLHTFRDGLAARAADPDFAVLFMLRDPAEESVRGGGVLSIFLRPNVSLGPLRQAPCGRDGRIQVEGTVVNRSAANEAAEIHFSWDGKKWQSGLPVTLRPYQETPFTLTLPSPAGPATLHVAVVLRDDGAVRWVEDPADNSGTLAVEPCAVTCDLTVAFGTLPAHVDQNGTRVAVTARKAGCPGVGLVPVQFAAGRRTERRFAAFDPARSDQTYGLSFDTGGLPLGATVVLTAEIDPEGKVPERREDNNSARAELWVPEPEEYCPDPDACAGSDITS